MRKRLTPSIAICLSLILGISPLLASPSSPKSSRPASVRRSKKPADLIKSVKPEVSIKSRRRATSVVQTSETLAGQSVTLLPDGRRLLIGGEGPGGPLAAAVIRDPRTNASHSVADSLRHARAGHSATLLPDGTVLIFGGVSADGQVLDSAELFNPETQKFEKLPALNLIRRAYHTATLLTTGRVLIAGGVSGAGRTVGKVEVWDPQTKIAETLSSRPLTARQKHTAKLLPNGHVLLWGGADEFGANLDGGELYDPETQSFTWTNSNISQANGDAPRLEFSLPQNGAMDVALDSRIALRFSRPLRMETVNASTMALSGPQGTVITKVIPAEGGMLAFITPKESLLPDATYTLTLADASNQDNHPLSSTMLSFKTVEAREPERNLEPSRGWNGDDEWTPDARNLNGDWKSNRPDSPLRSLPPLQAERGVTALAGQVLTLSGRPLANVTLQLDHQATRTDHTGRFLLSQLEPGTQTLVIRGDTASVPGRVYGTFDVRVEVAAGQTSVLPYTVWLPILDNQHAVSLPTPTTREVAVTTPKVPGMQVRVPSGVVLRMPNGMNHMHAGMEHRRSSGTNDLLKSLAITPIPIDRPPFPLPPGIDQGLLFTLQMHGAKSEKMNGDEGPGLRISFPNYLQLPAGTRVDFWNYDSTTVGWYLYGQGTVTPDRKQVVPDPGVELKSMHCISLMGGPSAPPEGPAPCNECEDGDPVDLGTGLFVYDKTDLILPDVIPISLTRTYRQNDAVERAFGKGATHPYEMYIIGDTHNYGEVILPDGGRIRFNRIPGSTPALYEHTATPSRFYKATLRYIDSHWEVKLLDGTLYRIYQHCNYGDIFGCHSSTTALVSIQDRYGNKLQITRDGSLRATKIASPNGRWIELTYHGTSRRIAQAKDNIGRTVSYTYDADGRLWRVTDAGGGVTEYTYDAAHRMLTIKDPRNIVYLTNEYDVNGRVRKQTQADATTYQFVYTLDGSNKVTQTDVTDPRGHIRRVTFNSSGYWLTDTHAFGRPEQQTITLERQAGSNKALSATDALGRRTTYSYDALGNVTSITRLAGTSGAATTTLTYEPTFNQVATVTDPLSHTTTYGYDTRGNLTSVTDALNHQTTFTYNAAGQRTSVISALGNTTEFIYDAGDLIEVRDPLGRSVVRYIDAAGRPTRITDSLGQTSRIEYDALNQPLRTIDPLGGVTAYAYDANGNLLSVTDARSRITSYTYNNMDRLVTRRDPLLRLESYEYDEAGNVKKHTDRRGKVTTARYDALDRAIFTGFGTIGEGETATYESTITSTYDAGNRLTQAIDSLAGTVTHSYNDVARTYSETSPQGTISYAHDAAGRQTSMTVLGQPAVTYAYDNADRLTGITQGSSSVGFAYDNADRRTSLTLPNNVIVEYGYDAASQLTSLTYRQGATTLGTLAYEYDLAGQRSKMGGSYARTGLPQTLTSTTYNDANQLVQRGATTFSYDLNGNLTNDGTNTYVWNARNQLSSISGGVTASFQYDAFGRRISKTVGGQTTGYLYDGANAVQELSGGTPLANILLGGIDEVFSRTDSAGARSFLTDGLGSTLALLDSAGATQTSYTYEPFGTTTQSGTPSSSANQYTGRENDTTTGLYYYRARYYSPALQRFISEDPIGFVGGNVNLYSYVHNDPVNFVDPHGLREYAGDGMETPGSSPPLLSGRKDAGPKHLDDFDWWDAFWREYWRLRNETCYANGGIDIGGTCAPLPMPHGGMTVVRGPSFLGQANGPAIIVPRGATGPTPAISGKGFRFTGGSGGNGLHPRVCDVRIMDKTPKYPNGYASYGRGKETLNPYSGGTMEKSDPWWHIPLGR